MTAATQYSALIAIRDKIRGLSLESIDSSRIYEETVAVWEGKDFPFVSVSIYEPERIASDQGGGGVQADDLELNYLVAMVAAKADEAVMMPRILKWREDILAAFHNERSITATVPAVQYTQVVPMVVFDKYAYQKMDLLASVLKVVVRTQKQRQS